MTRGYRKYPSRYGWNRPASGPWLAWTITIRVGLVVVIAWAILR